MPSTYSDVKLNTEGIKTGLLKIVGLFGKAGGAAGLFNAKAAMGFKNTALASQALNVAVGLVLVAAFRKLFSVIKKGFVASIKASKEYNQELANTQSVARGTVAELKELDAAARRAGETTRFTATEAAEALYYLASAGFEATEAVEALDGVLALAQATGTDMAITAEEIAVVISQFSLEAYEASRVANVFAAAITNSQATMEKMVFGFQQAGPIAAGLGISLEETAAAMELLFNAGFRGQRGGRALRNIMGDLSYESSATSKKLKALGLDFDKFTTSSNTLAEVFTYLNERGITTSETFAAFGKVASGQAAILVNAGAEAWKEMTDAVTGTNKAYEAAFIQNDTLVGDQYRLKSAAEALGITFGNLLEPALRKVTQLSYKFIRSLSRGIKRLTEQSTETSLLADSITILREKMTGYDVIISELENSYDSLTTAEREHLELLREMAKQDVDSQARRVINNYWDAFHALEEVKRISDEAADSEFAATEALTTVTENLGESAENVVDAWDMAAGIPGINTNAVTKSLTELDTALNGVDYAGMPQGLAIAMKEANKVTISAEEAANNYRLALEDLDSPLYQLATLYEQHDDLLIDLAETYPIVAGVIQDYIDKLPAKREADAEAAEAARVHIDATEDYIVAMAEALGFTDKYTNALFNQAQKQREARADTMLDEGNLKAALFLRKWGFTQEGKLLEESLAAELQAKKDKADEEYKDADENLAVREALQKIHDDQLLAGIQALRIEYEMVEEEYTAKHQENLDKQTKAEQDAIDDRKDAMQDFYADIASLSTSYVDSLESERDSLDNMTADRLEDMGKIAEAYGLRQDIIERARKREEEALKANKASLEDEVANSALNEQEKADKKIEINNAYQQALADLNDSYGMQNEQMAADRAATNMELFLKAKDEKTKLLEEEAKEKDKADQDKLDKDKEYYDAMIDLAKKAGTEIFASFSTLFAQISENKLAQLDRDLEAELEKNDLAEDSALETLEKELLKAKENGDEEEVIELQKAIARQKIEDDFAKRKAKVEYNSAMTTWALDSATAASKAAIAIIEAVASAPWPLNLPAIGFASVQGGTAITSQLLAKPQPPKFYTGGIVQGSKDGITATIGEQYQSEAILNQAQMARLLSIADGKSQGSKGMQVTFIHMDKDKRETARETIELVNKGQYLIDAKRAIRNIN